MMKTVLYHRRKTVAYAEKWAFGRNPAYMNLDGLGGDCTNFASQCLYAGCGVMNYTKDTGWYYRSPGDRAAAWTGVEHLYRFLTRNQSTGPFATVTGPEQIQIGDLIQLKLGLEQFSHTLVVTFAPPNPRVDQIKVAAHTFNAFDRPLSSYQYRDIRFLHIEGARTW